MLCTSCSRIVKPVVAVDIDGTLGDYHGHFLNFACGYLGLGFDRDLFDYFGNGSFGDWFCDLFGVDKTTFRQIKVAYRQGGLKRTMPVDPEAKNMMVQLHERAELWITTTRPYLRLDNIDPDTRFWLEHHGIPFDGLLYDEDKYDRLSALVDPARVVAVLDDLDEQYSAACEAFGGDVPILRCNPYNKDVRAQRRQAHGLWEACRMIEERIDEWEAQHDSA